MDILRLYATVIKEETGKEFEIYTSSDIHNIEELSEGGYNTKYDRQWNRIFSNQKAKLLCGEIEYVKMKEGLKQCLKSFISDWHEKGNSLFLSINDDFQSIMDQALLDDNISKNKVYL